MSHKDPKVLNAISIHSVISYQKLEKAIKEVYPSVDV